MVISVFCGVITLIIASIFVPMAGLNGAVASYAVPALLISLVSGTLILNRKRRFWIVKGQL